jgi:pathogenesis-related protein 1
MKNTLIASFAGLFLFTSCYYDPSAGGYPQGPVNAPNGGLGNQGGSAAPNGNQIQEFLSVHNQARAEVGLGPLSWSPTLASYATTWANKLAGEGGNLRHRTSSSYGENLYMSSGSGSPGAAARAWYAEKRFYNGGPITQGNLLQIGHYTQMVWRDTTEVGFGVARTGSGGVVIVANYNPPGNWLGRNPY